MMQFETETKTEAPSPEAESPSLWTEETLGDLVGLGERSGEGEPNVMSPEELFEEDPRDNRSQRGFSESPWSKGGLVYGVVGVGFLMFGFLMTQIFNQSSSEQPQLETQKPAEASVAFEEEVNEEGRLKTQLALSEQAERMKEIEQERRPQTQLTLADLESGDSDSPPAPSPRSTEPSSPRVRSRPATPPVRTVPRSLSPSPSRSLPPRLPPPRDNSRPSNPVVRPQPVDLPEQPDEQPEPRDLPEQPEPLDPRLRLAMLQSLGSYGGPAPSAGSGAPVSDERPQFERSIGRESERAPDSNLLEAEEAALLSGRRFHRFPVGRFAPAALVTPAVWAEDLEGVERHFVVALTAPLTNRSGEVVLPVGSEVVFRLERVHPSGLVLASGVSVLVEGGEQSIPPGAISLSGDGGAPLAADFIQLGEGEIASRDLKILLFGALGNLGSLLNRPDTESRFSSGVGGSSSETTVRNGDPNLVGALLEGGLSPMVEQFLSRNEAQLEALRSRPGLWFLAVGREVQILVNRSF